MKFYPPHYLLLLSLCMLSTWYFGNTEPQSFYFMILGLSLIGLGFVSPARVNTIDFVKIASTGNAADFGDLTSARQQSFACSNGHGGL